MIEPLVSALLHLVGQFHSFMDASSNKYRKILEWLDDVGEGEVIDDVGVVKRLFGIILGAKHKVLEKMYKVATGEPKSTWSLPVFPDISAVNF